MKNLLILLALVLCPSISHAADIRDLPKSEYVFQTLHAADMAETLYATNNPDRFTETNPNLGHNPSDEDIILFFAATSALHIATTMYLMDHHPEWVDKWENMSIVIKGTAVTYNLVIILK